MTFPNAGKFGGGRPPVVPVAQTPPAVPEEADTAEPTPPVELAPVAAADEPATPNEQGPDETVDNDGEDTAGHDSTAGADTAPPEEPEPAEPAKPADPPPAKPKRTPSRSRNKKATTPAGKADRILVVVQDGQITVSDPDVVVVDLDAASADDTPVADVVDLIASLKPVADTPVRGTALDALKDLVADKALA